MEPKAVIFDMDGVLADTVEPHYRSWKAVADRLGIPFAPEDNDKLRGLSRRDCLEALLDGRQLPEDRMFDLLDLKNDLFIESIRDMGPQDLLPGALSLLRELKEAGIHVGIASSSANVHVIIAKLEIGEYIEAIGDRYMARKLKPEPDLFLHTAALLQVPPAACLVIEDSEAGVQAGRAAGMCVIGVGSGTLAARADGFFPGLEAATLDKLRDAYARWRGQKAAGTDRPLTPGKKENQIGLRN
ncbi:MAG: beta-phosphoglucomutase [Bacteroidota bacterium]